MDLLYQIYAMDINGLSSSDCIANKAERSSEGGIWRRNADLADNCAKPRVGARKAARCNAMRYDGIGWDGIRWASDFSDKCLKVFF